MTKTFNFESLLEYDFYHLRYGKGAVIIAVQKEEIASAKKQFEKNEKIILENLREVKKAEKLRLHDLKQKLRKVVGEVIRRDRVVSEEEVKLKKEIENLEYKLTHLNYKEKSYFTNFQKAMFYTHNLAATNEVNTRIDPILKIEEHDNFIEVLLCFNDTISGVHNYHQKIMSHNPLQSSIKATSSEISGSVKRIIPKDNVTLEIISESGVEFNNR
ncbi:hypothetical protein [Desulfosediminicola flagellatus]|uniref:hypothetical protein n=1 Tax=Desulfosediminicola flagellatus TaxID=2569541 RepID=UPI0010AD5FC4|nr:hypothetical protein [Desulfosediminicola flagellatus]